MVIVAGKSPTIWSYTVSIHGVNIRCVYKAYTLCVYTVYIRCVIYGVYIGSWPTLVTIYEWMAPLPFWCRRAG